MPRRSFSIPEFELLLADQAGLEHFTEMTELVAGPTGS